MLKSMKNYYEILEVNQKASKEIIEKAYHVLVKKYHPDLYDGLKKQYAEKKIKEINERTVQLHLLNVGVIMQ